MSIRLIAKKSLNQRIALTPYLKKSIDLLQLSRFALIERIDDACQENPFLLSLEKDNFIRDFSLDCPENISLQEAILKQIPEILDKTVDREIAKNLTYCLDDNGFLELDSVLELTSSNKSLKSENLNNLIDQLQINIEPAGVFARNNRENIYIQCHRKKLNNRLLYLIHHMLFDFRNMDFEMILENISNDFPEDLIKKAIKQISNCDLSPGLNFQTTRQLRPDLHIKILKNGEIEVGFIKDDMPNVVFDNELLNDFKFSKILNEKTKLLISQAKWFIGAIENRNKTLEKVGILICLLQKDFIAGKRAEPLPLSNKDIAKKLTLSPSTISRVTRDKFILINGKILSLRNLLIPSVSRTKKLSPNDFVQEISNVINSSKIILSDQKIANILNMRGFNIARRTVAKYRNISGLKNSTKRKLAD
ncbi:MAG: hypothetical protein VW146_01450 [Gammaproteobacteria bacterium]